MKKSIIWLLTVMMGIAFCALLYFQIMYLENMVKMREGQFNEAVMRSLSATVNYLERRETLHFLEQDANIIESTLYDDLTAGTASGDSAYTADLTNPAVAEELESLGAMAVAFPSPTADVKSRYKSLQQTIRSQYLYQKGLLNEVIFTILRDAGGRPAIERADSTAVRQYLTRQLHSNGLDVPFAFAVSTGDGAPVYSTTGYDSSGNPQVYTQELFPNTGRTYRLDVTFPTKTSYIFSSVRFIIPTLALTVMLFVIFIFTIVLAFRQKKITEMKTDFINNMTHELKTPISTISLAAQMLGDDSVRKSPQSLKQLSSIITDESKRLRFQVEKVLQLSVFDDSISALKFSDVNANEIIPNVVHTFKIKVEKYGGSITTRLDAKKATVRVDEMQFTNVIFNLLDNAVKYMRPDVEPKLEISTSYIEGNRLEIRVRDNGIGIRKDDIKHIFEKFYRVNTGNLHNVKGFGLGLAYVKRMVTLFDGSISVESELGTGTTFVITLPLAE